MTGSLFLVPRDEAKIHWCNVEASSKSSLESPLSKSSIYANMVKKEQCVPLSSKQTVGERRKSEIAGRRLYEQALASERRKDAMRAKVLMAETDAMRLVLVASKKQRDESRRNKGVERLREMHDIGKKKIIADRERCETEKKKAECKRKETFLSFKMKSRKKCDSRAKSRQERSMRLCEIYELGKNKIMLDKERYEKKHKKYDEGKKLKLQKNKKLSKQKKDETKTKLPPSEGAGCRLYQQAKESEKRNSVLRAKTLVAEAESMRLVLKTTTQNKQSIAESEKKELLLSR